MQKKCILISYCYKNIFSHLAMDLIGITAIARHPTQPHIFVGGGSNGVLAFWDLRGHQDYPLSVVKVSTPKDDLDDCQKF